jgi:hypothetical protein
MIGAALGVGLVGVGLALLAYLTARRTAGSAATDDE